jgi:hypothetical protein
VSLRRLVPAVPSGTNRRLIKARLIAVALCAESLIRCHYRALTIAAPESLRCAERARGVKNRAEFRSEYTLVNVPKPAQT